MKINRPFYKNKVRFVLFLTALFCVSCACSQEASTVISQDERKSWIDDGYPFLYSRDRAALEGIESTLRERKDSLAPFASAVDFQLRRQGARYKGKLLSVKGRLLRAVYVDLPDERGYYDLWILLPDAERDPIRAIVFDAPKGFGVDDALENATPYPRDVRYRDEWIEALAVYYRTTSFDAGDDFFAAPTLVALDFKTTPSPTSKSAWNDSNSTGVLTAFHQTNVLLKGALFLILVCLWFVARVSYKRALKRAEIKFANSKTSTPPSVESIIVFFLLSVSTFAQEPTTKENEFWNVATGASLEELALERTGVRSALDDPKVARRREIALTTLGRMCRTTITSVLRERSSELATLNESVATPQENPNASVQTNSGGFADFRRFVGELKEVREIPLNESEKEKKGVEKLFRMIVELTSGGKIVVYTTKAPKFEASSGFFDTEQESKRVSCEGLFFGYEPLDEETAFVLLTTRVGWVPTNAPLGRAGVDLSSFVSTPVFARDALEKASTDEERKRIARSLRFTIDDSRPFYESLAAIKTVQDDREPISEAAPLFVEPEKLQGRPVKLRGWTRRVNMILVDDPDVRASTGLEKYWQIYCFTNDSQGAPLVLCTTELPEGLEPGGGKDFRREIELDGFFYKTWAYKTSERKRDETNGKSKELWIRAPLIIGRVTKAYPDEQKKSSAPVDASTIFIIFAVMACAWILLRRLSARPTRIAGSLKK